MTDIPAPVVEEAGAIIAKSKYRRVVYAALVFLGVAESVSSSVVAFLAAQGANVHGASLVLGALGVGLGPLLASSSVLALANTKPTN